MRHFHDRARCAQRRIVGDFLHREHRGARNVELAQDVDRFVLRLVGQPGFDGREDVEDVRLTGLCRGVVRIADPLRLAQRAADRLPGVTLNREVDVSVRVGFPALALEHPTRLTATAGVTATRHDIAELAVRILRILFEVADTVQTLLVAQLHAAQVDDRILHRDSDLLATARLTTADDGRQNTDREVHAGVAVAQRCGRHRGGAVPETRRRRCAACALRHVLVHLQVVVVVTVREALHRGHDQLRVEFIQTFPREAHAVEGARAEVLYQHVRFTHQLFEHFLAFLRLRVQRQRALVAVEHREVQGIGVGDVAQLATRDVARTRALHLDHVSAEPGQQLGTSRAGLHVREVDDLDSFEGFAHVMSP